MNTVFSLVKGRGDQRDFISWDNFTPRKKVNSRGSNFAPRGEIKSWSQSYDF
jgi:hypothetical protein